MHKNTGLSSHLINSIIKHILQISNPKKVILFGSRAMGKFEKESDIDLAIFSDQPILQVKDHLNEYVNTLLKIDVVNLKKVNKELQKEIFEKGITIYEKN